MSGSSSLRQGRAGRARLAAALALALAGCAAAPAPRDASVCVPLFRQYDVFARMAPPSMDGGGRSPRSGAEYWRWQQGLRLIQNGCRTRPADLAGIEALAGRAVRESGPSLGGPVAVHAGAITDQGTAEATAAFFHSLGLRATSIGDPQLGRRLYVGPVTTRGGLDALIALAFEAGFIAPYPSDLFRF